MADDLTALEPDDAALEPQAAAPEPAPAPEPEEDDGPLSKYSAADLGLDEAVKSQAVPGEAVMQPYRNTAGDSFAQAWKSTTGFAQQFKEYFAAKTIERAKLHGVAKTPGAYSEDGGFSGTGAAPDVFGGNQPSQAEYDQALQTLGMAKARKASDDSYSSDTIGGMAAYGAGALARGIVQPENLIQLGAITRSVQAAYAAKSAGEAMVMSMLAHGTEAGVTNVLVDSVSQGLEIGAGVEDHWSWQRSGFAGVLGFGLGGAMSGAATAIGRVLDAKRMGAMLTDTPAYRPGLEDPARIGEAPPAYLTTPVEPNRFKPLPDAARLETSNVDLAPGVQETETAIATRAPQGDGFDPRSVLPADDPALQAPPLDVRAGEIPPGETLSPDAIPGETLNGVETGSRPEPILSPDERAAADAIGGQGTADEIELALGGDDALSAAAAPRILPETAGELKQRIEEGSIAKEEIHASPVMRRAIEAMEKVEPTSSKPGYNTPDYWAARDFVVDGQPVKGIDAGIEALTKKAESYSTEAPVEAGRQAYLVIGPPAAGKSTFSEGISARVRAAIIDADDAKAMLPEFQGGIGASAVHEESADLSDRILDKFARGGTNIVLPKVGGDPRKIQAIAALLKTLGYDVHLVNVNVAPDVAHQRMISRFLDTGRLIDPTYFDSIGTRPTETYRALRKDEAIASHAEVDANGPRGSAYITDGDGPAADALSLGRGRGGDVRGQGDRDLAASDPGARRPDPAEEAVRHLEVGPPAAFEPNSRQGVILNWAATHGHYPAPGHRIPDMRTEDKWVHVTQEDLDGIPLADQNPYPRYANDPPPAMVAHAEEMVAAGIEPADAKASLAQDGDFIGDVVFAMRPHTVTDAANNKVQVQPVVVELRDLLISDMKGYDPELQPRNRDRAASAEQIRRIVTEFDPVRLGHAAEADRGAPIVGPDRMVESGNGRMMALREIYESHPDKVAAYQAFLAEQGIEVGKYDQPVLVRQRLTELTRDERVELTLNANKPIGLGLGAAEVAKNDAKLLTVETLDLIRNADTLDAQANNEFMARFLSKLAPGERATLQTDGGQLNAAGLIRVRNAIFAAAYDDQKLLHTMSESLNDEVKSITKALMAAAPEWAKLRAEIAAGIVRPDMDLTPTLVQAVKKAAYLREKGIKLDAHLDQVGMFGDDLNGEATDWLRMFYNPKGKRANGFDNMTDALRDYAEAARQVAASDLGLTTPVSPAKLQAHALEVAHAKFKEDDAQGRLLPLKSGRAGDGDRNAQGRGAQPGSEPGGAGGGTPGASLRRAEGGAAGDGPNAQLGPIAQPLRASAGGAVPMTTRRNNIVSTTPADQRTFPNRRELDGEAQKPIAMPAGVTPEQIREFSVTNEMIAIANALGRKLEIDGRFTIKGALGEYKPQMGVLRIRQAGDMEVFAHELGHAVDQRLTNQVTTGARFAQLKRQFGAELKKLDPNEINPTKQTTAEGLAEYLRLYINNPAYARNQAPGFAPEFERLLGQDPELAGILDRAARVSQIDNALSPTQALAAMVADPPAKGLIAKARQTYKKEGLRPTVATLFDTVYTNVVAQDHYAARFVRNLRDAAYEKTGAPLQLDFADPYKKYRMLPGANQAAVDAIMHGVRPYGGHLMDGPVVAGLHEHLSVAFNGRLSALWEDGNPLVKSFNGYLIARRAAQLYDRFKAGQLPQAPIRASREKNLASIAEFEAANPTFKQAADGVFAFTKTYWDKKFDAGLIPRDIYEAVNAQGADYIPFLRDMGDEAAAGGGTKNGVQDNGLRKIKGSSRDIISPIHSIIEDVAQTERMIAHNDTIKGLHKLAKSGGEFAGRFLEQVPNTELKGASIDLIEAIRSKARREGADKAETGALIAALEDLVGPDMTASVFKSVDTTPKGERILFYWDGGQRVAVKVGNDEVSRQFFDVYSALATPERDIAIAMFGKGNALFSAMVTNAPEFGTKNLVADNVTRMFMGRNVGALGRVPGAAIALGIHTSLFDREFARSAAAYGLMRGGVVSQAARELDNARGLKQAFVPRTMKEMKAELLNNLSSPVNLVKMLAMSPVKAWEKFAKAIEYTETAGRLGQAKLVFAHLKKQGLSDDEAFRGALFESNDIMPYDRRGGSMGAMVKIVPFLNPGIQGTDRALRNLVGGPLEALRQANLRGGLDKIDADARGALNDAIVNWGMIAAGIGITAGYTFHSANDQRYQKETDYMRRRYYIFYTGGDDKDGNPMKITIPKPFDLPGALMSTVESYIYGMMRQDPETYAKAAKHMLDGFVPRQFMSWEDLMTANPFIKTTLENATGMKVGFEGRNPMPVVPRDLQALPPEMQYDAYSSWLSKKIGQQFGLSPKKVEHIMDGIGATMSRDVNAVLTAAFDENPRMTQKDAMNKLWIGGLYRQDLGGGQARADVMKLMAFDNGTYAQLAAGYRRAIENGDDRTAETLFNRGNDTSKALMILSSDAAFKPEMRVLHPLVRTEKIGEVVSAVLRDLSGSKVKVEDRSRKRGQLRETIDVPPATARALAATMTSWMAEEMRNGLAAVKEPGYATYPLIDTAGRLEAIRALNPDVADEIEGRLTQRRVLPIDKLVEEWPRVKDLVLSDRTASAKELARTYKELSR